MSESMDLVLLQVTSSTKYGPRYAEWRDAGGKLFRSFAGFGRDDLVCRAGEAWRVEAVRSHVLGELTVLDHFSPVRMLVPDPMRGKIDPGPLGGMPASIPGPSVARGSKIAHINKQIEMAL